MFNDLPADVWWSIWPHMEASDLIMLSQVNRRFHSLLDMTTWATLLDVSGAEWSRSALQCEWQRRRNQAVGGTWYVFGWGGRIGAKVSVEEVESIAKTLAGSPLRGKRQHRDQADKRCEACEFILRSTFFHDNLRPALGHPVNPLFFYSNGKVTCFSHNADALHSYLNEGSLLRRVIESIDNNSQSFKFLYKASDQHNGRELIITHSGFAYYRENQLKTFIRVSEVKFIKGYVDEFVLLLAADGKLYHWGHYDLYHCITSPDAEQRRQLIIYSSDDPRQLYQVMLPQPVIDFEILPYVGTKTEKINGWATGDSDGHHDILYLGLDGKYGSFLHDHNIPFYRYIRHSKKNHEACRITYPGAYQVRIREIKIIHNAERTSVYVRV